MINTIGYKFMQGKDFPLVSVIMNCYNGAEYLREAIDSIYAQTYQNWEIIFWDNASTDNTAKIAKSYDDRLKYFKSDNTTPLGEAKSLALKEANGDYLSFLDCDDCLFPNKFKIQIEILEKNPTIYLLYSSYDVIDARGFLKRDFHVPDNNSVNFCSLIKRYPINQQTVLFRKKVLDNKHIFINKSLTYSPDYDFFIKIASEFNIGSHKEKTVQYREHSNSLSKRKLMAVSNDVGSTLTYLEKENNLKIRCPYELIDAKKKLTYYDVIYFISINKRKIALKRLETIIFNRVPYFLLFIFLWIRIPNKLLLKLLKR